MAAGSPIATAFVRIRPTTREFGPELGRQLRKTARSGEQAGRELGGAFSRGFKRESSGISGHIMAISRVGPRGFGLLATGAKAAGLAIAGVGVAGAAMGLKTASSMEQARISFTTMLGSAHKADVFLRQLARFAAQTPFEFPELQTAASSLISAGINASKVIPIMRTLGDVTSGMGTGSEGVRRATIALQQMAAAGKITGEDLNQLRDAGVPVFDLLAAATGKSKAEIVKLAQAGKLGSRELGQLMKTLESGKGLERFSGLMEKQSHSLAGLFSTLKDNVNMALANLITPAMPVIKAGLVWLTNTTAAVAPRLQALFAAAAPRIAAAFNAVAPKIQAALGVVIPYVRDTLVPGTVAAFGAIKTRLGLALSGIDLSGIARSFAEQARTWGAALINGVRQGLDTGDWSGLGETVGRGLIAAISGAANLAKTIAGKIGELFGKVDWIGLGITVGKQAVPFLAGIAIGLLNFDLLGLLRGLAAHWQEALFAVLAVAFTPGRIVGKVGELLARIPLVGKLLEWALLHLKAFSNGLVRAVGRALGFLGEAFVAGFRRVFPGIGENFLAHLRNLPTYVGVVTLEIIDKARLMMRRLAEAVGRGIGGVVAKIGELVARMLRPFVNAGSWLVRRGIELVSGLIRGVRSYLSLAVSAAGQVISRVTAPFRAAGRWLLSAGRDLVGGLFSGIRAAMSRVGSILSSVKDAIVGGLKRLFGISSPSTVMAGIGGHMITGLIKGLLTSSGALAKVVRSIGGNVAGIFGGIDLGFGQSTTSGAMQKMVAGYASMLYGWTGAQWAALRSLLMGESGFNPNAQNPTSSAYGLFQFLDSTWGSVNATKTSNPQGQTLAGLRYIKQRYGDPISAYSAWSSRSPHWYDSGGWLPPGVSLAANRTGQPERILSPRERIPTAEDIGAAVAAALVRVLRSTPANVPMLADLVSLELLHVVDAGSRR